MEFAVRGLGMATEVGAVSYVGNSLTVTDASDYVADDPRTVFIAIFENKGTDNEEIFFRSLETVSEETDVMTFAEETNSANTNFIGSSGAGPQVNGVMNIDGVNDYVYRFVSPLPMQGFGQLSTSFLATTAYMLEVSSDDDLGYKVYVSFPDADDSILNYPQVSDGHVSVGETEIGGRSSDVTLDTSFDTQDAAITNDQQVVAHRTPGLLNNRDYFALRVGVGADNEDGSYAGDIQFAVVGDY
jgi:hypothetical protein